MSPYQQTGAGTWHGHTHASRPPSVPLPFAPSRLFLTSIFHLPSCTITGKRHCPVESRYIDHVSSLVVRSPASDSKHQIKSNFHLDHILQALWLQLEERMRVGYTFTPAHWRPHHTRSTTAFVCVCFPTCVRVKDKPTERENVYQCGLQPGLIVFI